MSRVEIPWVSAFGFYEGAIKDKLKKEGYDIKFIETPDVAIKELESKKYEVIVINPEFHYSFNNDEDFKKKIGAIELRDMEVNSKLWLVGKYIIERTRQSINKETPIIIIDDFERLDVDATSKCMKAGANRYIRGNNIETIVDELNYYTQRFNE